MALGAFPLAAFAQSSLLVGGLIVSLLPFAYDKGGKAAGFWTVVGFGLTLLMI